MAQQLGSVGPDPWKSAEWPPWFLDATPLIFDSRSLRRMLPAPIRPKIRHTLSATSEKDWEKVLTKDLVIKIWPSEQEHAVDIAMADGRYVGGMDLPATTTVIKIMLTETVS